MLSRLFFFFLVPIFFISCKKEEDRSCFKTTGSIIDKIIPLGSFSKIHLGPYIQYELIQDTMNFIEISAGENIINFISSDIEDGKLLIENNNKCRFLRYKKEKVIAKIHFININMHLLLLKMAFSWFYYRLFQINTNIKIRKFELNFF